MYKYLAEIFNNGHRQARFSITRPQDVSKSDFSFSFEITSRLHLNAEKQGGAMNLFLKTPWSENINAVVNFNHPKTSMSIDASIGDDKKFFLEMNVFQTTRPSWSSRVILEVPGFLMELSAKFIDRYDVHVILNDISINAFSDLEGEEIASIVISHPQAGIDYAISLNHSCAASGINIIEGGNQKFHILFDHYYDNYLNWRYKITVRLPIEGFEDFRLSISSEFNDEMDINVQLILQEKSTNLRLNYYPTNENTNILKYTYINIDPDRTNEFKFERIIELECSDALYHEDSASSISFKMRENSQHIVYLLTTSNRTSTGRDLSMNLVSQYSPPLQLDASYEYHSYDNFLVDISLRWNNTYDEPQHIKFDVQMNSNAGSPCLKADLVSTLEGDFPTGDLLLQYDFNDQRKNATAKYTWNRENYTTTIIEFFADSPTGIILHSGITIRTNSYDEDKFAHGDILARSDFSDIELKVEVKEDTDKMLLSAKFTSPIKNWEFVEMEGSLEHNKVLKTPVSLLFCNRKKVRSNLHHL